MQCSLRSEEAHRLILICRPQVAHFNLITPPPTLYRYNCSSSINTYTGAIDALNIVEAWIRKKKKKSQQMSPNIRSGVLLMRFIVNYLIQVLQFFSYKTYISDQKHRLKQKERTSFIFPQSSSKVKTSCVMIQLCYLYFHTPSITYTESI